MKYMAGYAYATMYMYHESMLHLFSDRLPPYLSCPFSVGCLNAPIGTGQICIFTQSLIHLVEIAFQMRYVVHNAFTLPTIFFGSIISGWISGWVSYEVY